jgi:16S rRNA (uracil1498-N3)-methyltransferase
MTRRRWIADESSENKAALVGAHAEHLARVLRARVGQQFEVATGSRVRLGRIAAISPQRVEFELGEEIAGSATMPITLILSIFKFDRMEWAIEKCTELGVLRVVPAIAERTDVHLGAAAKKRVERWRRIAQEASEQARRNVVPEILDPMKIQQAAAMGGTLRVVLAESEMQTSLKDVLQGEPSDLVLAVGPEGGWTKEEITFLAGRGWTSASLGKTILRAETAAIAAVAIALSSL